MARRIKVTGIDAVATAAIALLAGLWVAGAGLHPTGSSRIDFVLVLLAASFVVWTAASAPWWAGVMAATSGAALAPTVIPLVLSVAALVAGLTVGMVRRSLPWSRALVAGASLQALARLGERGPFGMTAAIGVGVSTALAVAGIVRRPRRERRMMVVGLGGLALAAFLSIGGLAVAGATARPELENGNRVARQGISQLAKGDFAAARASFADAARIFARADGSLDRFWSAPAALLPGVAQNRHAIVSLVSSASSATAAISHALDEIDLDALRPRNGAIDVSVVRSLEGPIRDLNTAIDRLEHTVSAIAVDPWVVGPIADRVSELSHDVAKQQVKGIDALHFVQQAPAMLGGDGKRIYFIAFVTPAEARGGGGFMGNWAELTVDNGVFKMTRFGRHKELNVGGDPSGRTISGPANWADHWGPYGLIRSGDLATYSVWSNVTMSPNFPDTAQVISELYPQSGGRRVDGVFSLDVEALATLLDIVGPVQVDGLDEPLTSANAVDFLLKGQYLNTDNDNRIDTLEQLAKTSVDKLFHSDLPAPPELAALLAPLAAEGHLKAWAVRPAEERVFVRANMAGELPEPNGGDGFTFALTNGAGNKIDAYLEGDASYLVTTKPSSGEVTASATLVLRNTAPAAGLPDYVIGNLVGLPTGYDRTFVSLYSTLPPQSMTVDGDEVDFKINGDDQYWVAGKFVDIPPGDSVTITVRFQGQMDLRSGYRLVYRAPTLAAPIPVRVEVDGTPTEAADDSRLHVVAVTAVR